MPGADFNLHVQTKRPSAQKPAGVLFVKLGMVGIYKKEIGLGGPDDLYRPV